MEHLCSDARKILFFVKLLCGAYKLRMCVGEPVLCPSPHSAVTPETSHRSKMWGGSSHVVGIGLTDFAKNRGGGAISPLPHPTPASLNAIYECIAMGLNHLSLAYKFRVLGHRLYFANPLRPGTLKYYGLF